MLTLIFIGAAALIVGMFIGFWIGYVTCNRAEQNEQHHFIIHKLKTMSDQLTALQAAVAAENTVIDSAEALLKGLKEKLDAAIASGDPAALQALSDSIGAKSAELAAAVTENTPAE